MRAIALREFGPDRASFDINFDPGDFLLCVKKGTCRPCGNAATTLAVGESCVFTIGYQPKIGESRALLTVTSSEPLPCPGKYKEISVDVSATGIPLYELTPSPANVSLSTKFSGSTYPSSSVPIRNTGANTLNVECFITAINVPPAFRTSGTCGMLAPTQLEPGKACSISVEFMPKTSGRYEEQLVCTSPHVRIVVASKFK